MTTYYRLPGTCCFWYVLMPALIIFGSCNNAKTDKKISSVDSLYQLTVNMEKMIAEMNIEKAKEYSNILSQHLDTIKKNYTESISHDMIPLLIQCKKTNKILMSYIKNDNFYKTEIRYTKEQLQNLKHDVKKNVISDKDFQKYYKEEAHEIIKLNNDLTLILRKITENMNAFDSLNVEVNRFIEKQIK